MIETHIFDKRAPCDNLSIKKEPLREYVVSIPQRITSIYLLEYGYIKVLVIPKLTKKRQRGVE